MARKTIFDILSGEIDAEYEYRNLVELLKEKMFAGTDHIYDYKWDIEDYIDKYCFHLWKDKGTSLSCRDMRTRLGVTDDESDIDVAQLLIFLEYILNICNLIEKGVGKRPFEFSKLSAYHNLLMIIATLLDKLGYKAIDIEETKTVLVEKDAAAFAAAEIVDRETARDILEYNHFVLKGSLEEKRKILLGIASKVEALKKEMESNGSIFIDDEGFLANNLNIRHNNKVGKNKKEAVAAMSNEVLEEWYDETYQVMLLCILEHDHIERKKKIQQLKAIIGN